MAKPKIAPGTLCMIRSTMAPCHSGKIVVAVRYNAKYACWETTPKLHVPDEPHVEIVWNECALTPLKPKRGRDEMLRITGKPTEAQHG